MTLPDKVNLIEVGPRDGFQAVSKPIPTDIKVETIEALARAGVRHIQVTSFVHPKWVPQMADAEEVCRRIPATPEVRYRALALNQKGVERAHAAGITRLDLSVSVSETHSHKNANVSVDEALRNLREMVDLARQEDIEVRVGLQCVFGCAYEGPIPSERILDMAEELLSMKADMISLADTTGMANPLQVKQLLSQLLPLTEETPLVLHLHDTRGTGLANLTAALECGVNWFDTALAGLGGCPFIPGATGNIATEDTLYLLHSMGIETGIDLAGVAACSRRLEQFLGRPLPGKMYRLADQAVPS
ncbi:MAG: hydroxymethylglutaryl-CoA lyase [Acidobacteriota bacterium]|nr:hydroxymethylglutaryl-CoA lyase [Acidobacteriota bacterium]